jgi:hypothetical protein
LGRFALERSAARFLHCVRPGEACNQRRPLRRFEGVDRGSLTKPPSAAERCGGVACIRTSFARRMLHKPVT